MSETNDAGDISARWSFLIGVVFGGTALFGLKTLHRSPLVLAAGRDWPGFAAQLFFAAYFFVFFAYAACAYFRLTAAYEYRLADQLRWSGPRCLLDLAMAFLLYVMLITAAGPRPESSTLIIFSALVLWHLAAAWRLCAQRERGEAARKGGGVRFDLLKGGDVRAHLLILGGYALSIFIWGNLFIHPEEGYRKDFDFLWVICAGVLLTAVWRTRTIAGRAMADPRR